MDTKFAIEFEKSVRFLVTNLPETEEDSRKPILFHNIQVGEFLYNSNYSRDIVLAGLLHDTLEWSHANESEIVSFFGENVLRLIKACTKNDTIQDKNEKTRELISRCVKEGEDALVVKSADILDSFRWYAEQMNEGEIQYCVRNARMILELKPAQFEDKIFSELENWLIRYS